MRELPENKFGYLLLGIDDKNDGRIGVLVKANKIAVIAHSDIRGLDNTLISFGDGDSDIYVEDTIDEILEQLENIHPNLR